MLQLQWEYVDFSHHDQLDNDVFIAPYRFMETLTPLNKFIQTYFSAIASIAYIYHQQRCDGI